MPRKGFKITRHKWLVGEHKVLIYTSITNKLIECSKFVCLKTRIRNWMNFVSATVCFNNLSQIPTFRKFAFCKTTFRKFVLTTFRNLSQFMDRVDIPLGLFTAFYIPSLSLYHPSGISGYDCVWCIMSKQCIFIYAFFYNPETLKPIVLHNDCVWYNWF